MDKTEMYNEASKSRLAEKVGYELWILKYIAKTQDVFVGDDSLTSVEFNKEHPDKVLLSIILSEEVGINHAIKVIESMNPLIFISCYKIIDMIFEWILEENLNKGNIKEVPWQFAEKIKVIKKGKLEYPTLIQSESYLIEYLFSIYNYLTMFRNEIIHNNRFSILDEKLKIETVKRGVPHILEINRIQMGAFVRVSIAYANLLVGKLQYSNKEEVLIKHNLDKLLTFHKMDEFNQIVPIFVTAIYNVSYQEGSYLINLTCIREKLKQIYCDVEIVFDLKVIGYKNEKQIIVWKIPVDHIPNSDHLILKNNDFKEYITWKTF